MNEVLDLFFKSKFSKSCNRFSIIFSYFDIVIDGIRQTIMQFV